MTSSGATLDRPEAADAASGARASAPVCLTAVSMGYGHLRPAAALSEELGTPMRRADASPLADARDRDTLGRMNEVMGWLSRGAELPFVGDLSRRLLDEITAIPRLRARGRLAAPNSAARHLRGLIDRGFGRDLVAHLARTGERLLSTFYAQALIADAAGLSDVTCVVTDAEVNRVWVAHDPGRSRVRYCVPLRRTARRMLSYGVAPERLHVTGFPLPPRLLGGRDLPTLRRDLGARLHRLDPSGAFRREAPADARAVLDAAHGPDAVAPLRVAFAVGGAGAQAGLAIRLLRALRTPLERGEVHLTIVAGTRRKTAARLHEAIAAHAPAAARAGGVAVLYDPTFEGYLRRFEACLAATDVLFTKPSEMTFFGALGLPLALTTPLGFHEGINGRLARRKGFGLDAPHAHDAARWLLDRRADGSLARAAWAGYARMPKHGTYLVADLVRGARL